jgi:hypothetical protein
MFRPPTKYSEYLQDVRKSIDYILKRVNAITGSLQLNGGVAMSATPTAVTDKNNTASTLKLSTNLVQINGALNFPKSYTGFNEPNIFITAQNQPNPESFANVNSFNLSIGATYVQDGVNPFDTGYGNTYVGLGNSAIAGNNSYFNAIIGYASSITVAEPGNLVMGYGSFSSTANAVVIGRQASVSGFNGSALGYLATTSTPNGFAIGNATSLLQIGGNFTPTARVHVKGLGSTSATLALLVQNSSGNEALRVNDALSVGIGASSINASAKLQVDSTTQGFLPPRVTTIQKNTVATPVAGLEVYDSTTNTPNYYNGTTWVEVASNQTTGLSPGLFAQTTDSTAVTNTTVETTIISTGVGTLSVPANQFQVGASYVAYLSGVMSSQNNAILEIHLKSNGSILADTNPMTLSATTGKFWELHVNFTIRSIGAGGVAAVVTSGRFSYNKDSGNIPESQGFSNVNSTSFDTTINNTLVITAQWGNASPLNSIQTKIFNLYRTY